VVELVFPPCSLAAVSRQTQSDVLATIGANQPRPGRPWGWEGARAAVGYRRNDGRRVTFDLFPAASGAVTRTVRVTLRTVAGFRRAVEVSLSASGFSPDPGRLVAALPTNARRSSVRVVAAARRASTFSAHASEQPTVAEARPSEPCRAAARSRRRERSSALFDRHGYLPRPRTEKGESTLT
jgi:hypothetical protein